MNAMYIVPTLTIILNVCSAIFYLFGKDLPRCVYWLCAALLTFCVTFWIKN